MRLSYHPDTDAIYIDLAARPSVQSREVAPGVVIDYDAAGHIVGIDIDNAMAKLDLSAITLSRLPAEPERHSV